MSVRQGNKIIAGSLSSLPHNIGEIFPAPYASYTPEGAVLADGAEFDSTQFPDLWNDYIQGGRVLTCTYEEFDVDVAKSGGCAKFAVNGNKFRVPKVGKGTFIAGGNGESFAESLPNIKGELIGNNYDMAWDIKPSGAFKKIQGSVGFPSQGRGEGANIGFDASQVSPAYQDNAKVQPNNIRMKFYVQVASGSVNQSMMDWSRYMQGLEGKANTDADNFNTVGKQSITSWGFPSDKFIDLSLGASGAKITVPADGYISLEATTTADKSFVRLKSDFLSSISFLNTGNIVSAFLPVKKGEEILIEHRTIKNHIFRFIYAEGEK